MKDLTFCIAHHGSSEKHTRFLQTCIDRIRLFHPESPVVVCKTSTSVFSDSSTQVFDTFLDGSSIVGCIELLTRVCETENYIIIHDSMFMLKRISESIIDRDLYNLWHFHGNKYENDFPARKFLRENSGIEKDKISILEDSYESLAGVFGPAFGGKMSKLEELWGLLNTNIEKFSTPLWACSFNERYFSLLFSHLGCDPANSINGDIFSQPNNFRIHDIPDFNSIDYPQSYFYKIWVNRTERN